MSLLGANNQSVFVLEDLDDTLSTDGEVLLVKLLRVLRRRHNEIVWAEVRGSNNFAVAVEELDWHVGAVLRKEGDGLFTSLDSVPQVPHWSTLRANIVGGTQLCNLIVALILFVVDQSFKFGLGKVILTFAFCIVLLLTLILFLRIHDVVHLGAILVLEDLISVHVVKDLATLAAHVLSHGVSEVSHLLSDVVSGILLSLVVQFERQGELSELNVRVEIIQPLEVGAVLALSLRLIAAGEHVLGTHLLGLHTFTL